MHGLRGVFFQSSFLILLWFLLETRAETHWVFTLLASVPPHVFVLPTALVILVGLFKKRWKALLWQGLPLLLWLFLLMGLQLHPPRPETSNKVRVMTWNVHGGLAGLEPLLSTIQHIQPEVLCLQEARITGPQIWTVLQKQDQRWQMAQVGELVILSRFPVVQKRWLEFPNSFHTALEATLQLPEQALSVVTVHLDRHRLGPTAWDQRMGRTLEERTHRVSGIRQDGVDVVLKSQGQAQQQKQAFLACGDFNMPPLGPLYRQLEDRLDNAFAHSGLGFGFTWNASLKLYRIDHLWFSPDVQTLKTWVEESKGSDHLPVVTDLQLQP